MATKMSRTECCLTNTVDAQISNRVDSVMNPSGGTIRAKEIKTLIMEKDRVDVNKTKIICEA